MKSISLTRIMIAVACINMSLAISFPAYAQSKVLIANGGGYSTRVLATNRSDVSTAWSLTEAGCYPYPAVNVVPGGAAIFDKQMCDSFALVDSTLADVKSIIHFSDGKSESSFVVPPLGAVTISSPAMLGPAINDDATGSYITFFASEKSAVTVTLYDGSRNVIAVEATDVPAGISQFRPATKFSVGFVKVELGYVQFGITPSKAPLYGFLSVASPTNGNSIVYPF